MSKIDTENPEKIRETLGLVKTLTHLPQDPKLDELTEEYFELDGLDESEYRDKHWDMRDALIDMLRVLEHMPNTCFREAPDGKLPFSKEVCVGNIREALGWEREEE